MTPEQKQLDADSLLRSLVETPAGERIRMKCGAADLRSVITDLLSLVKSQEADDQFDGPCVSCGHNNYDAERKECAQRWMEGQYSVVCGCPCAKHNSIANVAASTRSACVEKVKAIDPMFIGKWMDAEWVEVDRVITALESVSIQEQEAKQS